MILITEFYQNNNTSDMQEILLKFKRSIGTSVFRVTKYLCYSLKIPYLFIKNLCAETKSVLTEVHENKTSFSHSHIVKDPFTANTDKDHN